MGRIKYQLTLSVALSLMAVSQAPAQQPRTIHEPAIGIEFTVPEGWQYQKTEAGYVMGHNNLAGLIIVATLPYKTMAEMRQAAYEGIQEEGGTMLQIEGDLAPFGHNGLAGSYRGTMAWEEVKAYAIGVLNPKGGPGVNCMVMTTPTLFSNAHIRALEALAGSFRFSEPVVPDIVKEWEKWFKSPGGCRLKYMHVTSSTSYGGGYSGGSSEETIDLCPNGYFGFSSSSNYSMSIDAGSAYSADSDDGQGQWALQFNGTNAVLVLNFNDGRATEYELTYEDGKTYLSGSRYFVLFDEEGPGCY